MIWSVLQLEKFSFLMLILMSVPQQCFIAYIFHYYTALYSYLFHISKVTNGIFSWTSPVNQQMKISLTENVLLHDTSLQRPPSPPSAKGSAVRQNVEDNVEAPLWQKCHGWERSKNKKIPHIDWMERYRVGPPGIKVSKLVSQRRASPLCVKPNIKKRRIFKKLPYTHVF